MYSSFSKPMHIAAKLFVGGSQMRGVLQEIEEINHW